MPYEIKALPKETFPKTKYSKSLPQPVAGAFRVAMCGCSGSGKTTATIRMIQEMRPEFRRIIVWAPDISQYKRNLKKMMNRHDKLIEGYSDESLKEEYGKQMARMRAKKPMIKTLFVLDDCIQAVQKSPYFEELNVVSRKSRVSLIYVFHKFTSASPIARANMTHLCLFSTSHMELSLVCRYLGLEYEKLKNAYDESRAKERFRFVYVSCNPAAVFESFSDKRLL